MAAQWDLVESQFRGIFERRYFANHGPVLKELDRTFATQQQVRDAICVTNEAVGIMILAKALAASGEVIVPAYASPATLESLRWAGLTPVLTDVDPVSMVLTHAQAEIAMSERTSAICGIHLFGIPCDPLGLALIARKRNCALFFDARDTIGCLRGGRPFGGLGAGEVFSFNECGLVNGAEGGCITTDNEELSQRVRTMRSFQRNETFAPVPVRMNAKMSEAQAALALCGLDFLDDTLARGRAVFEAYEAALGQSRGLTLVHPRGLDRWNYGRVILDIDPMVRSIARVIDALHQRGIWCARPIGLPAPLTEGAFPGTTTLRERLLEVPSGRRASVQDAFVISEVIERA